MFSSSAELFHSKPVYYMCISVFLCTYCSVFSTQFNLINQNNAKESFMMAGYARFIIRKQSLKIFLTVNKTWKIKWFNFCWIWYLWYLNVVKCDICTWMKLRSYWLVVDINNFIPWLFYKPVFLWHTNCSQNFCLVIRCPLVNPLELIHI